MDTQLGCVSWHDGKLNCLMQHCNVTKRRGTVTHGLWIMYQSFHGNTRWWYATYSSRSTPTKTRGHGVAFILSDSLMNDCNVYCIFTTVFSHFSYTVQEVNKSHIVENC